MKTNIHTQVIHDIISSEGLYPNNNHLPFLIYKNAVDYRNASTKDVTGFLKNNHWYKAWVNGIYNFHHYHSNTHEVLLIYSGKKLIQIGGDNGKIYEIEKGDVIFLPAGVSHKSVGTNISFCCIGAYPYNIDYDMNYGRTSEHPQVAQNIKHVKLPKHDPIFGKRGPLFKYWK